MDQVEHLRLFHCDSVIIYITDYPMCVMSSALKKFFLNLMKKCTKPTLKLVYQRSVENMVQDLSKGIVTCTT